MRNFYFRHIKFSFSCIIILAVSEFAGFAQINNTSLKENSLLSLNYELNEKIYLHSDRDVYVSGENIFFKAYYFLNGTFNKDSVSRILYVDLVDKNGQAVTTGKYRIENGMADGNLSVQQGLSSGYYTVYAYTKLMMNFDKVCFFSKKIYIINPENELKILKTNQSAEENAGWHSHSAEEALNAGAHDKSNKSKDRFQIETLLNKEIFHVREKVDIKVKTKTASGNIKNSHISVSAAKSESLNNDKTNISDYIEFSCNNNHLKNYLPGISQSEKLLGSDSHSVQHSSEIVCLPETSGFIISGTILATQTNKPIPDVNIYMSTLSDYIDVQNSVTRQDGRFYFLIDEKVRNSEFVIQPADTYLKEYRVILDKGLASDYPSDNLNMLRGNKFSKKFFDELLINYQIEKQYNPDNHTYNKSLGYSCLFYGNADSSYSFDKFIDLPAFEEYFVEIFNRTKIIRSENGKRIKVKYPDSSAELNQFPLLLVDGLPVFDVDKFLSISPSEIEKVDIVNNNYVKGRIVYGGIIYVYTKKKNFAGLIDAKNMTFSEFKGYTEKNKFTELKYTDDIAFNSRKADYRNTLYWNPEVKTDENGEANISFYTSDERGKFLITIVGVAECGETCSKKIILEVE